MRVLILSANTGGGHNSAANAVKEAFIRRNVECDIRDTLCFLSEVESEIISTGHTYMYRYLPRLFGVGYRFEEKHPPKFIYEQMARGAKRFAAFLREQAYDAIVCTHIFGSMMVTEAHRKYGLTIPQYLVTTDYAVYPGTDMVDVDAFFIPSVALRQNYVDAGIAADRVIATGIPVGPSFLHPLDKLEARQRLRLPTEGRIVLMCCGSIGCGRLHRIAPEFERRLPEDATLVIICGRNMRSYRLLHDQSGPRTVVVGYTHRIAEYMAAADVCVSKPGGLSTTEMLVTGLPMVLMLSVPGCETRNLDFFQKYQAAVGTEDWEEAAKITAALIRDPDRLAEMRDRLLDLGYPGGADFIVETVLKQNEQK